MKTIPLKKYVERRGAQTELSRLFGITAGAMCQMVKSERQILVDIHHGKPIRLREEKLLAEAS